MTGTARVRWCPNCRSWGRAMRTLVDPLQGYVTGHEINPVTFDYVREEHRCNACEQHFTTARITRCSPDHIWRARGVLDRLHSGDGAMTRRRAIPLSWDHHPELADFSAAILQRSVLQA